MCPECGKEFVGCKISIYCSNPCGQRARARAARKPLAPISCEGCGKVFTPERADKKTCCHACAKRVYRYKMRGETVLQECATCGKWFYPKYRKTDPMHNYCSTECLEKAPPPKDSKLAPGLTLERCKEIAQFQKIGGKALYRHSLTWTPAERNWARRNYESRYAGNDNIEFN